MPSTTTLTVSDNLTVTDYSGTYTRHDLARSVAYWSNIINNVSDPRPLAICFGAGSTTFQTVAVLLAIIDSGRNYYKFDQLAPGEVNETIKYPKIQGGVSVTFITGTVNTDFDYSNDPFIYEVESSENSQQTLAYHTKHSLDITFRLDQKRYNNTSGTTTGYPKLIEASVGNDGYSVKTAMDYYIKDTDHCVFSHSMSHIGVHTTAILPSIFKASTVTFADSGPMWAEHIKQGTHTQFFYTMLDYYNFPEDHCIETVTTGGDYLSATMVNELIYNSGIKRIVDIYGLTEAAPPLAIREITCLEDLSKPFIWINDAYECYLNDNGVAVVVRPDGVHWVSNDYARYNSSTNEFYYLGRQGAGVKIRMKGLLFESYEFREKFELETCIVNYFLDTTGEGIPILIITHKDEEAVANFIREYEVTVELKIVNTIDTNGGIKNTR
jgi:acyl-CoA synthetase (AMP-forming)/AMP-acid ligase II